MGRHGRIAAIDLVMEPGSIRALGVEILGE
jgi:hypothetical protein